MRVLTALDREEIAALRADGEYFWLDLTAPGERELEAVAEVFGLHPMVLENLREPDQRPKLDDYGDYVLVVFYGALVRDDRPTVAEVELVIHGDYLISVHEDPQEELEELQAQFARRQPGSEEFVVYRVLDALTDTFFPVLADMDDEIDRLEDDVISAPGEEQLQRLFRLKRDLVTMRKVITPQRDLLARAGEEIVELPGMEAGARDYFRDVYDHLIRISDLIDSYRDLLTGAMDVHLTTVSNRLNVVMKRLTVVATIFLPLTFVTGFFGQNFAWMVTHVHTLEAFLLLGVGAQVLSAIALWVWFRSRGLT